MKRLLLLFAVLPLFGATYYVRVDGHVNCNGTVDAAGSSGNCAERNIADALNDADPGDGNDIIKVGPGLYNERITVADANIIVEARDPNGAKPVIGGTFVKYDRDATAWTLVDGTKHIWKSTATWTTVPRAAYITSISDYENGRLALVPYNFAIRQDGNRDPNVVVDGVAVDTAWWTSFSTSVSTCIDSIAGNNDCENVYYIGPGVFSNGDDNRLYIRLAPTTESLEYERDIKTLFNGVYDPRQYTIVIGDDDWTVRITAANVTLRNLFLEANKSTVQVDANNASLEGLTIWAGNSSGVRTDGNDGGKIRKSFLYYDTPYYISWIDCKETPEICYGMKSDGVALYDDADNWLIEDTHIRGFHDCIGTEGTIGGTVIRWNRIENCHDDAFELEGDNATQHIYGNFITNSLTCASIAQDSGGWVGPLYFFGNTCVQLRPAFVQRTVNVVTWNSGDKYRYPYALKWGDVNDHNTQVANNTFVLLDSPNSQGINLTDHDATGTHPGDYFVNNILMKVNGRVGNSSLPSTSAVAQLDYNLYYSIYNPSLNLLDSHTTTQACCDATSGCGWECNGVGDTVRTGTNPGFDLAGFGCFNGACGGLKPGVSGLVTTHPGSWVWDSRQFIPASGNTTVCGAGRGTLPAGFPDISDANYALVDPNIATLLMDPNDIGAIPCSAVVANFNHIPLTLGWTGISSGGTPVFQTGIAPVSSITEPAIPVVDIEEEVTPVNFCATFSDVDGAPPYTHTWTITGAGCPVAPTGLCPGEVTFPDAAVCVVSFKTKDRWGLESQPATRTINVRNGPQDSGVYHPSQCGDCRRCVCDVSN